MRDTYTDGDSRIQYRKKYTYNAQKPHKIRSNNSFNAKVVVVAATTAEKSNRIKKNKNEAHDANVRVYSLSLYIEYVLYVCYDNM